MQAKINGSEEVVKKIKDLKVYPKDIYFELFYNRKENECWVTEHCDFTQNNFLCYNDPNIIKICNLTKPIQVNELESLIRYTLS